MATSKAQTVTAPSKSKSTSKDDDTKKEVRKSNEILKMSVSYLKDKPNKALEYQKDKDGISEDGKNIEIKSFDAMGEDITSYDVLSKFLEFPAPVNDGQDGEYIEKSHELQDEIIEKEDSLQTITNVINNSEKTKTIFNSMTPDEQLQMTDLFDRFYNSKKCSSIWENLISIMEQDKLMDKDSMGNTLLNNLSFISQQRFARNLDGTLVFEELTRKVSNPNYINQGETGNSTATSLEYIMIKNSSAEFLRLMSGLTSEKGVREMIKIGVLHRADNPVRNKDIIDKGLQDALGVYGTSNMQLKRELTNPEENVTSALSPWSFRNMPNIPRPHMDSLMQRGLNNKIKSLVGMPYGGGYNEIFVERIDDTQVYVRDAMEVMDRNGESGTPGEVILVNWEMLINNDCDEILTMSAGGKGSMSGDVANDINMAEDMSIKNTILLNNRKLINSKEKLKVHLQQANLQNWQPSTPQLKMKIQQALNISIPEDFTKEQIEKMSVKEEMVPGFDSFSGLLNKVGKLPSKSAIMFLMDCRNMGMQMKGERFLPA